MLLGGLKVSSINQALISMQVVDNVSIMSLHGAYAYLQNKIQLDEKQSLFISYCLPLAVYENRLLWNGGASKYSYREVQRIGRLMFTSGNWSFLALSRNVQLNVNYVRHISPQASLDVRYEFFRLANFSEAPIRVYANTLMVGLKFRAR